MLRRVFWIGLLASVGAARAASTRSASDPLRVGIEQALVDSGLAKRLQTGFALHTGLALQWVPGSSARLLEALEQGELDASLTSAPELEMKLAQRGLAHDRQAVAEGELVLVGPLLGKGRAARDPAGIQGGRDIVAALTRLSQLGQPVLSAPEGGGAYLSEQGLWRLAQLAPRPPWYTVTPAAADNLALAAAQGAYTLTERGRWLSQGRAGLALQVEADPRLACAVHVMRSFRVNHPAARLFVKWLQGPNGRRAVAQSPGWKAPQGPGASS